MTVAMTPVAQWLRVRAVVCAVAGAAVAVGAAGPSLSEDLSDPAPVHVAAAEPPTVETPIATDDATAMRRFLDRLMMAESGGRDDAKNPRSTALGPFQFIESTFIEVSRRHFPAETQGLSAPQLLALRTKRDFSRRVAEAFTHDNAARLAANGVPTTFANLRLAFFLGPGAAIRVLKSEPRMPVIGIVGVPVVQANPFMAGMTAERLVAWSERNLAAHDTARRRLAVKPGALAVVLEPGAAPVPPPKPAIQVACNTALPSCRRWVVLAERQLATAKPRIMAKRNAGPTPR